VRRASFIKKGAEKKGGGGGWGGRKRKGTSIARCRKRLPLLFMVIMFPERKGQGMKRASQVRRGKVDRGGRPIKGAGERAKKPICFGGGGKKRPNKQACSRSMNKGKRRGPFRGSFQTVIKKKRAKNRKEGVKITRRRKRDTYKSCFVGRVEGRGK